MDAAAQLALMTKAKAVFETPGSFLSFPALSPLSFAPAQLDFTAALSNPAAARALEDFSRAVNLCPADPLLPADQSEYLWDHYDAWLTAMQLAHSELGAADLQDYAAARALLVVTDGNGLDTDSPVLIAYKQCRDAAINAQQAYTAAELTATTATDPAMQAQWQNVDEPRLRAALTAASANWSATGHKADVEAAQAVIARCEAQMPEKMWSEWRQAYTPALDQVTDAASNASYVPSGFSPANIAEQGWTTLSMGAAEIAALSQSAPAQLKSLFGTVAASSISSISFEFRSASIVRPWLNTAMFGARFWKFPDATLLSDGAAPPAGAWPAYVSAVVFARNVKVTDAAQAPGPTAPPQLLRIDPPLMPVARPVPPPVMIGRMPIARPVVSQAAMSRPLQQAQRPALGAAASAIGRPLAVRPMPVGQQIHPVLRLSTALYRAPPAPPAQPAAAPAATPDVTITVLAFICRTLPKCPDPDSGLQW